MSKKSAWSLGNLLILATPGLRYFQECGEPHPIYVHDDGRVVRLPESVDNLLA